MTAAAAIAIAAMALWSPGIRQNFAPTSVREIARANNKLPDGTLKVPRGGITLDDGTFLASVAKIGRRGDVLISDDGGNRGYHITWLQMTNEYIITILKEPYAEHRARAEAEYLALIGSGNSRAACQKNVSVVTATWITPQPRAVPEYCVN
jgi:hypothetical protein